MKDAEILLLAYLLLRRRRRRRLMAEKRLSAQQRRRPMIRKVLPSSLRSAKKTGKPRYKSGGTSSQNNHYNDASLESDTVSDAIQIKVEAADSDEQDQSSNEGSFQEKISVKEEPLHDWEEEKSAAN